MRDGDALSFIDGKSVFETVFPGHISGSNPDPLFFAVEVQVARNGTPNEIPFQVLRSLEAV